MNVESIHKGMEERAMDPQFLKDIFALYDPNDYGDTESDCQLGYQKLLPVLNEEQKTSLEQMEQAYTHRREYAAKYGFKCGILGAIRQLFGLSRAQHSGFQDLLCDDLLTQPNMQRHQENYANVELCNQMEQIIMDTLYEDDREHLVSISCAWQQRVYSAAHHAFYCGYRSGWDIIEAIMPMAKAQNTNKILDTEYAMGVIHP